MQELAGGTTITFPSRWAIARTREEVVKDLNNCAKILITGCEAICRTYLRLTDMIRGSDLTDSEVREILERHFPPPRVSEILRVARAPEETYRRYAGGFFGFKAALRECRLYEISPSEERTRRAVRRAAERLARLLTAETTLRIRDKVITVTPAK